MDWGVAVAHLTQVRFRWASQSIVATTTVIVQTGKTKKKRTQNLKKTTFNVHTKDNLVQPRSRLQAPYSSIQMRGRRAEGISSPTCTGHGGEESADDAGIVRELGTPPANFFVSGIEGTSGVDGSGDAREGPFAPTQKTGLRKASTSPVWMTIQHGRPRSTAGRPQPKRSTQGFINSCIFAICDLGIEVEVSIEIDELGDGNGNGKEVPSFADAKESVILEGSLLRVLVLEKKGYWACRSLGLSSERMAIRIPNKDGLHGAGHRQEHMGELRP
ncbi:hypothetical protein GALMADRAFT_212786 [Galerina marginata CBS 339.88]|uniref:Uncharacterized protein n=1 Tax=Galerina marginata (strain CBS 339.88) TaxID=685588 RepID=A0A067STK8_GALM3|nr:hypothetical protein GALMADRAFT_212786 [Galerina marginata CBS 339.88]